MGSIVAHGRTRFQSLCKAASKSINLNPRRLATPTHSGARTPRSHQNIHDPAPAIGDLLTGGGLHSEERCLLKKQETQYMMDSKRPNVHVGLHYKEMMDEYGLPSNMNVLIGEDKHR